MLQGKCFVGRQPDGKFANDSSLNDVHMSIDYFGTVVYKHGIT